jgi:uncharacterized protein YjbJ (UPF0337 family)
VRRKTEWRCGVNKDEFEGKWLQLRGAVKNKWGQLTDNELDQIQGNYDMLIGKVQEKYGQTREAIDRQLDELLKETKTT